MPRQVAPTTKLAREILRDGRPAYIIAAAAHLKDHVLWAYYTGRKPIPNLHLRRLCVALSCDPVDIVEAPGAGRQQPSG